jgi:hypothetical protein
MPHIKTVLLLLLLSCCLLMTALTAPGGKKDVTVSFKKDIKPILEKSCYKCHGSKKQKGSLRLDQPKEIVAGGGNGAIVVPGDADRSALYSLTTLDSGDDDVMPSKGDHLTKEQTEKIRLWIKQGALFEDGTKWKKKEENAADKVVITALDKLGEKVSKPPRSILNQFKEAGIQVKYLDRSKKFVDINFSQLKKEEKLSTHFGKLGKISRNVVSVGLKGKDLKNVKLSMLAGFKHLHSLHLEKSTVSDKQLKGLDKLEHLRYINLYGTGISDKGLKYLEGCKSLKKLYLWGSKVTEKGVKKLKNVLPEVKINF